VEVVWPLRVRVVFRNDTETVLVVVELALLPPSILKDLVISLRYLGSAVEGG
jgi:hypothetical protein